MGGLCCQSPPRHPGVSAAPTSGLSLAGWAGPGRSIPVLRGLPSSAVPAGCARCASPSPALLSLPLGVLLPPHPRVCSRFPPPLGAPFLVPIPSQILTERLLEAKHRALRPCPSRAPSTSLTSPQPQRGLPLSPHCPPRPAPPPPRSSLRGRVLAGPLPARLSRLFNPALFPVPSYPSPDPSRDNPCPQHRIWVHLFLKWKLGIRAALGGGGVLISSGTGVPPQC